MTRRYDHRIRNLIVATGNPNLFPELKIPQSTARDWIRKGKADVVTCSYFDQSNETLVTRLQFAENVLRESKLDL